MRKMFFLFLIVLVVALGILVIKNNTGSIRQEKNKTEAIKFQTQTNSEDQVSVEVTPISLSDKEDVRFNITLNTHSVALEKDLKEIYVLIDDKGREYKPISWDGGTGGSPRFGEAGSPREAGEASHHLEGNLIFPKLEEGTKSVKLIIKGIGADRTFLWTILKGS